MLCLTRGPSETIRCVVPPSTKETIIEMQVVSIGPRKVKTGWTAPRRVGIVRTELGDWKPPTQLVEED